MKLLCTDTDSFLICVQNTFAEIEAKLLEHNHLFYFSNLSENNPLYRNSTMILQNRRRVGLLKLKTADNQMTGFVCLQPKCYSLLLDNGTEEKKGKGIPKSYIQKYLNYKM